jgi:hypothetical protein
VVNQRGIGAKSARLAGDSKPNRSGQPPFTAFSRGGLRKGDEEPGRWPQEAARTEKVLAGFSAFLRVEAIFFQPAKTARRRLGRSQIAEDLRFEMPKHRVKPLKTR